METNPETHSNPIPQIQVAAHPATKKPLSGWGSLMAVLLIINGALTSLTIILAILGVPLIIAGVKLLKAISVSRDISSTDVKTNEMIDNLNSFFKINGIVFICSIVLGIIGLIIMMAIGIFAAIQGANNF